jgi:imidazolonepropionase-like amidohydrolase
LLDREAELGSIETGKIADIIAVPENPLERIESLNDVFFVVKEGQVFRNDQAGGARRD